MADSQWFIYIYTETCSCLVSFTGHSEHVDCQSAAEAEKPWELCLNQHAAAFTQYKWLMDCIYKELSSLTNHSKSFLKHASIHTFTHTQKDMREVLKTSGAEDLWRHGFSSVLKQIGDGVADHVMIHLFLKFTVREIRLLAVVDLCERHR